jgi:6-phosphogluconate dehydrogenase
MTRSEVVPVDSVTAQVGVVGLAVMGANLARNLARHGHTVALYNRTTARTDDLVALHGAEGTFLAAPDLQQFVTTLERPRRILLMVMAGAPTDATLDALVPLLEPGDIVVDGGNAHYEDTRRREQALRARGLHFVGAGISGGEEGALLGPSIMPGGSRESYEALGPLLEDIAAKVDGEPCCAYMGSDGAGHFVKMVHNGIEYADMQFIAEAYDLLRTAGMEPPAIADVFREWNTGDLDSFLIEITAEVLDQVDAVTGRPLVDVIADAAEQKGTGRWTVQSALELGTPVNAIAEAVFARSTSGHTALRQAARGLPGPAGAPDVDLDALVTDVRSALWASKVVAYAQGLDQIATASTAYGWDVDLASVAKIWRAGCIIRARLLERIRSVYAAQDLTSLLVDPEVAADLADAQDGWRRVVGLATASGVPVPGFSSALAYYDTVRKDRLPAALVQGLRDCFGAHTYRRVDQEGTFHTLWSADRTEVQVTG